MDKLNLLKISKNENRNYPAEAVVLSRALMHLGENGELPVKLTTWHNGSLKNIIGNFDRQLKTILVGELHCLVSAENGTAVLLAASTRPNWCKV